MAVGCFCPVYFLNQPRSNNSAKFVVFPQRTGRFIRLDQRTRSALSRHHDRHCTHPLQRGLVHYIWMHVLSVRGGHHRFEAHGPIAAHHSGGWGGGVCRDHQSLGGRERVAAIGKWWGHRSSGLRMARQWSRGGRRDHCVAVSSTLGWCVSGGANSGGEGLASVSVVVNVGVGVITGFRVVPVAAVVSVCGRQCVVLRGRSVCMESLHWWRSLGRKIVLSVEKKTAVLDVYLWVTLYGTHILVLIHLCENFHTFITQLLTLGIPTNPLIPTTILTSKFSSLKMWGPM